MTNEDCRRCPLGGTNLHTCIGGEWRGAVDSAATTRVMVVGEAPGANEDQQGRPFVGELGRKLDHALAEIGLGGAYLTNVIKCRPPNNKMQRGYVKPCADYLDEEIARVAPTHILALGNTALQRLLGKGTVTAVAGKEMWSDKYHCWVMAAWHPAYLLRAPGREKAWLADLHHFGALVRGEAGQLPELDYMLVRDIVDLAALAHCVAKGEPFTYDFEATPIPIWHRDWRPYSIAFCFGEQTFVLPLAHPDNDFFGPEQWTSWGQAVRPQMQDPARSKTTHNDLYDAVAWQRTFGYYPYTTCDTMVLAHLLDENRPKGLKWLGRALLGWPDWDVDATKEHPLDELARYNAYDALATYRLRERLLADLEEQPGLKRYFQYIEMPKIRAVGRMIVHGVHIDKALLDERIEECTSNIQATATTVPVRNAGSAPQVAQWLYGTLKLPVIALTPGGQPSTDEATIHRLAQLKPEIKPLLENRKWRKYQTTYLAPVKAMTTTSWDGRAHFEYRSTSVETGRLGSRFHTMPRDQFVRSIVSAPTGWTLLSLDYSQIEARLAAWWAAGKPPADNGSAMLHAFMTGRDIYKVVAAAALRKPYERITKDERQLMGKVPSLAMIYKVSPQGFKEYAWKAFEVDYSVAQATQLHRTFYQQFPEIERWHRFTGELLLATGEIADGLGRIRHLPEMASPDRKVREEAIRAGINAPIQSTANGILQAAHAHLQEEILFHDVPVKIVGSVHDALLFEVRDDALDAFMRTAMRVLVEGVPYNLQALGLVLPDGLLQVEAQVGPWGSPTRTTTWAELTGPSSVCYDVVGPATHNRERGEHA